MTPWRSDGRERTGLYASKRLPLPVRARVGSRFPPLRGSESSVYSGHPPLAFPAVSVPTSLPALLPVHASPHAYTRVLTFSGPGRLEHTVPTRLRLCRSHRLYGRNRPGSLPSSFSFANMVRRFRFLHRFPYIRKKILNGIFSKSPSFLS